MASSHIVHLPLDAALSDLLAQKAALAHKGVEEIIDVLLRDALERDEDLYFARLSATREQNATFTMPHAEAWKDV